MPLTGNTDHSGWVSTARRSLHDRRPHPRADARLCGALLPRAVVPDQREHRRHRDRRGARGLRRRPRGRGRPDEVRQARRARGRRRRSRRRRPRARRAWRTSSGLPRPRGRRRRPRAPHRSRWHRCSLWSGTAALGSRAPRSRASARGRRRRSCGLLRALDTQPLWSVFPVSGIQTHRGRPRAGRQAWPPDGTAQPLRSRPGRRRHRVAAQERDLFAGGRVATAFTTASAGLAVPAASDSLTVARGTHVCGAMSRRAPSRQGSRAAARSRYTLMDMDVRSLTRRFLMTALAVAVLAAAGAVCLALPGPAGSAVPAREHGATALLGRAPGSLAELQKEARRTRAQMERLNAEMEVVTQKWEAARRRLDEVNAKLVQARRQLTRSRNQLDRQRALVAGRMRTMYKTGEFTWLDP